MVDVDLYSTVPFIVSFFLEYFFSRVTIMAKNNQSFEDQLAKLQSIQSTLERGDVPIEEMLAGYEQGMKLVSELRNFLANAEQRITDITKEYAVQSEDDVDDGYEEEDEDMMEAGTDYQSIVGIPFSIDKINS